PPPAVEDDGLRGTYEKEQEKTKRTQSTGQGVNQQDAELTELAAPAPVSHRGSTDEEAAVPIPTHVVRHDEPAESPTSSSTRVKDEEALTKAAVAYAECCTISWIVFFAILGTLARLGVQAISTYPDAPFTSTVLWANLGGSLLRGFLLEDRRLFRYGVESKVKFKDDKVQIDKVKKTLPLYIGLSTGFCGSFTSFSTFITDAFLALTNDLPSPSSTSPYHAAQSAIHSRNGGYSFMATAGPFSTSPRPSQIITTSPACAKLRPTR
ncbi:hypothetical protein LTR80_011763, partial [Exophiala xenobiotica]